MQRPNALISLIVTLLPAVAATGQCGVALDPGDGYPGADGAVRQSAVWDPDGAGPAGPLWVDAGWFSAVGATRRGGGVRVGRTAA